MKTLPCVLAATLCVPSLAPCVYGQNANQIRDRGQTPVATPGQSLDYGRLGRQGKVPLEPPVWDGVLVDAGCADRTNQNLRLAAEPLSAAPVEGTASGTAHGVSVAPETLAEERSDVMRHQIPDLLTRQSDPTCAITGNTTAFALLMDDGRLFNLDEGGNTYAIVAVQSTGAGRELLAGKGPGIKPRVSLIGRRQNDRLKVDRIETIRNGQ